MYSLVEEKEIEKKSWNPATQGNCIFVLQSQHSLTCLLTFFCQHWQKKLLSNSEIKWFWTRNSSAWCLFQCWLSCQKSSQVIYLNCVKNGFCYLIELQNTNTQTQLNSKKFQKCLFGPNVKNIPTASMRRKAESTEFIIRTIMILSRLFKSHLLCQRMKLYPKLHRRLNWPS